MISSYWNTRSSTTRPTSMSHVFDGADTTAESGHWQLLHHKEDDHSTGAQLFTGGDSRLPFCLRWRWNIRRRCASSVPGLRRLRLSSAFGETQPTHDAMKR